MPTDKISSSGSHKRTTNIQKLNSSVTSENIVEVIQTLKVELTQHKQQIANEESALLEVRKNNASVEMTLSEKQRHEANRPTKVLTKATNDLFSTMNYIAEYLRCKSSIIKEWEESLAITKRQTDEEMRELQMQLEKNQDSVDNHKNQCKLLENENESINQAIVNDEINLHNILVKFQTIEALLNDKKAKGDKVSKNKDSLGQQIEANALNNEDSNKDLADVEKYIDENTDELKRLVELGAQHQLDITTSQSENRHDAIKISELKLMVDSEIDNKERQRLDLVKDLETVRNDVENQSKVFDELADILSIKTEHNLKCKAWKEVNCHFSVAHKTYKVEFTKTHSMLINTYLSVMRQASMDELPWNIR